MARLSDLQIAGLLEELAAAMRVDLPVAQAMERLRDRRLGAVATAAGSIADALKHGQNAADAIRCCDSPIIDQASAAIQTSEVTGNPGVLTRLSALLRWRAEYLRASRLLWLYPLILLIIAYVIAAAVMAPMLRNYQGRDFSWSKPVMEVSRFLETNWWLPPMILAAAVVAWLVWQRRSHALPRDARIRLFCQSLIDQITADVPESEAIRNAAMLSGETSLLSEANPTFKSPPLVDLLRSVRSPLLDVPGASEQETLVARLKYLAAIHDQRARRHVYLWSTLYPRIAMVVIGGGFTLAYVWWVIAPVYLKVATW